MFATDEIKALAASGQKSLENVDKVTTQAEVRLADLGRLLDAFKLMMDTASKQGITITIKLGSTGE
jgi:hypothetical protein